MLGHHTGIVPSHSPYNMAHFRDCESWISCSCIYGFRLNWRSLRTEDLSVPLSLTPTMPYDVASPHLFQEDRCPIQWLVLWEALAQPQGSAASAMVWHGLQRAPSFQQQPKGSCKLQFENQPSVFSPHLEDVGLSWHWVVDAIDGEDNRGQSIDSRTWNVMLLEREG